MHNAWMRRLLCTVFCAALTALSAPAARADPAGEALAQKVYDRPNGNDAVSVLTMSLIQPGRAPRNRRMVVYRLDKAPGEVATLIRFTEPEDIAGTGLLTLDHKSGDSDQWIYLPAMERVRRIASNRKGGRFVNSEYYYEDLRERKVHQDHHRILGKETVNGIPCEVLESIPVEAGNSAYLKRVSFIDPNTLLPLRVDFYEKNEQQPSKRLTVSAFRKISGFWTVTDSTMTDLANGNATRLTAEKIQYNRRLPARLFTTEVLEDESLEEDYRP
ncbi:outer membrane lipoprotein-sorting protein [Thiobacter aerophilum]|uniref:Outer membrane lipoprotein-sorting protein n=1 Tax=Thiobacter aerophilum TaxID=3121275 RepID=A0ABV0ECS1_9BURK